MKASVKHIRISPKKANLVAGIVKGEKTEKALRFLKLANKKAADIIYKVLEAAVANAKNNDGKLGDNLYIKTILVTKGRTFRRGVPASRGRVAPILKRTSHIFITLCEKEEEKPVKATKEKKEKKSQAKTGSEKEEKLAKVTEEKKKITGK